MIYRKAWQAHTEFCRIAARLVSCTSNHTMAYVHKNDGGMQSGTTGSGCQDQHPKTLYHRPQRCIDKLQVYYMLEGVLPSYTFQVNTVSYKYKLLV
mgnify:CR=1 FL=1